MGGANMCDIDQARRILQKKHFARTPDEIHQLAVFLSSEKGFLHQVRIGLAESIAKWAGYTSMDEGAAIMREGEPGDVMFIVLRGFCKVFRKKKVVDGHHCGRKNYFDEADVTEYGCHVGWVSEKEIVGEQALVAAHKPRNATVICGERGVELITFERSTFNHFANQARHNLHAFQVLEALRASCCRRILQISPNLRTDDDAEALVEMTAGLEGFLGLPLDVRTKLARTMMHEYLPPGAVLFEEDDPGDSFYVVLSGQPSVRARALAKAPKEDEQVDAQITQALGKPAIQNSLLNVKSASTQDDTSSSRHETASINDLEVPENETVEADKKNNSQYWISKYFHQARNTIQAQDPVSGSGNQVSPLAAVYAAKWRQTIKDRKAAEEEHKPEELTGMAALLGPAAAKMWRQRTFGDKNRRVSNDSNLSALGPRYATQEGSVKENTASYRSSYTGTENDLLGSYRTTEGGESSILGGSSTLTIVNVETEDKLSSSDLAPGDEEQEQKNEQKYDPSKTLLAEMGKRNPANVSTVLLAEVGERTQLSNMLTDIAKQIHFNGAPRRLTRKDSKKLTKLVNRKLLGGPSHKGYGQSRRAEKAILLSEHKDDETDTHTDIGVSEWRSSIDYSETMDTMSIATFETHSEMEDDFAADNPYHDGIGGDSKRQPQSRRTTDNGGLSDTETCSEAGGLQRIDLEQKYGPVVRRLKSGESFGELALLTRRGKRTATVLAEDQGASLATDGIRSKGQEGGIHLIRVTKVQYDIAARSVQAQQLEDLLKFIKALPPFKRLPRDKLTSVAIFCRPMTVEKGSTIVHEGDLVDVLYMIKQGEVTLCTTSIKNGIRRSESGLSGYGAKAPFNRRLLRQMSAPVGTRSEVSEEELSNSGRRASDQNSTGDKRTITRSDIVRQQAQMSPLMALGKGEIFGEAVFGYKEDEGADEIQDGEDNDGPTIRHGATVVASHPTELLTVSASDLLRFGRKVQQELKAFATKRRDFNQKRKTTIQGANRELVSMYAAARKETTQETTSLGSPMVVSATEKENDGASPLRSKEKPSRSTAPQTDAVKKAGIAWLMEDVQNLTYSACAPRQRARRSAKITGQGADWQVGSRVQKIHSYPQNQGVENAKEPGVPPLSPASQEIGQRHSAGSARSQQTSDATDGFLDEFTKLERAFRERLAIKERETGYPFQPDQPAHAPQFQSSKHSAGPWTPNRPNSEWTQENGRLPAAIRKKSSGRPWA